MKAKRTPTAKVAQIEEIIDRVLPILPSHTMRLVLLCCARRANLSGEFTADAVRTAKRLGVSLRKVQRSFDAMRKAGMIEVARENPRTYRLNTRAWR